MPSARITIAAAAALLSALLAGEARAELREFRVYEENDFFNPFTDRTDRYYTQGLRVEWLNGPRSRDDHFLPGVTHAAWCSLFCGTGHSEGPDKASFESGYAFGQNMYTPQDITIAAPQPYDRPWAGMSYVSRVARISYRDQSLKMERQDRIEVQLGIVGPAALTKQAQIWWHKVIDDDRPEGWNNQLRNEPVLQLRYETAIRWWPGRYFDVIPRARGNLGNALTSLEAEVTVRLGGNLSGFGVPSIPAPPPVAALSAPANTLAGGRWTRSFNVFGRAGIKAVAHNIFLDGNTFARNDIRIDRKAFVSEFAVGTEMNLIGNLWLTFQFIRRGSEFRSWLGDDAPAHEFGAITVAWIRRDR